MKLPGLDSSDTITIVAQCNTGGRIEEEFIVSAIEQSVSGGQRLKDGRYIGTDDMLDVAVMIGNGEITDIRFTQKSGNAYLDDSAYKAIVKANPVSPHPDAIRVPYVTVALRFTPEGLRK